MLQTLIVIRELFVSAGVVMVVSLASYMVNMSLTEFYLALIAGGIAQALTFVAMRDAK